MKSVLDRFKLLSKAKKIQIVTATILTALLLAAFPVFAWFTSRKQVATIAKVNSPAKLSIKSGYAEDILQFEMSGIDVGDGNTSGSKDFVFCVEGADISGYKLQITHTTNIDFTYTLYKAHSDANGNVDYIDADGVVRKYTKAGEFVDNESAESSNLYGGYINASIVDGRLIANSKYAEKSYDSDDYKDENNVGHIQYYAEPLYWQTKCTVNKDAYDGEIPYNEYNSFYDTTDDKKFLNFYVLEVSWLSTTFPNGNDKETDLIYITAKAE